MRGRRVISQEDEGGLVAAQKTTLFPPKIPVKKTKPWTDGGRRVKYIPMDADDVTYRLRLHMLLPLQCNGTVVPTK